ncbi:hypothetical protein ABEB36_002288 [Hypothenemus hampei]|uniref:C2HC/C3H-type domain-containing protein n=1 Tax=Hypothenemus hampei TaxID=57062 RepID=A0ABD1F6V6_HYPHA
MTSKLAQMQARFQQKQMQEKEEKLLKMYENQQQRAFEKVGRGSAGSNGSTNSLGSTGGGKVRQMFEERRQKAGIDKSYPLEPLKSKTATRTSADRNGNLTNRTTTVRSIGSKSTTHIRNGKLVSNQKESFQRVYQNENDTNGHDNLVEMMNKNNINNGNEDVENLPKIGFNENYQEKPLYLTGKLANVGGKLPSQRLMETQQKNATPNIVTQSNGIVKNESKVATKKSIAKSPSPTNTTTATTKPAAKKTPTRRSNSVSSASSQSSRNSPARPEKNNNMSSKQLSHRAPTNNKPSSKQTAKSPVVRDDLAECKNCGRRFATDRLGVHEEICQKTARKRRKAYDATKHRVQGTELESYVKGGKKVTSSKKGKLKDAANKDDNKISAKASKAGNWRKTHEEFIATIRAAKQAQAYVAKGGKLSDLPPPPPSTNPDYVQCPHCGRRFNEAAAERHIPKCATYDYNKPKNATATKGRPVKR